MTAPSTCCGKSSDACVCATQAKCSCGKNPALKCTCDKAVTENKVEGARCSCRESFPLSVFSSLHPYHPSSFLFNQLLGCVASR